MKKLDIDKIITNHKNKNYDIENYRPFEDYNVKNAIRQAIKEILPQILEYVSENAKTESKRTFFHDIEEWGYENIIDEKSILSLQKEIIEKLGI